jgi:tetratricopeptide (TPR) repeat protein
MSDEKQAIAQNISLLISRNRSADARVELERLLALDPEDPESRSLAGDVYAWTGADAAAYKQYNMAADTFNRLGRADKALGVHHKILDLDTSMMDAANQARIRLLTLLVGAEDALVAGQNDKAVAGYSEAIRQFPNHTITYQRLGSLLVRLGRHGEAVEQYLTVGRAFYAHGVLPKARPYFERVLELQADQGEALEAVLACLKTEGKESEGIRFMKAAVQQALERGRNEDAAAWFERLPESSRDGATPLGAALLLQSGEVGQAERMVTQLDLKRSEVSDWFKTLGRSALDRGDSLSADVFFRWGTGQVEAVSAASIPTELPSPAPELALATPPPGLALPVPPPGLALPSPPPGLALPPPVPGPPPLAAPLGLGLPTPPPGLDVPPAPPPHPSPALVASLAPAPPAPIVPVAVPQALVAAVAVNVPEVTAAAPSAPQSPETQDDRSILQTMGEMCLAEEMFEEAKQVFERLTKAEPQRELYWDLLNRARQGLGLSQVLPAAVLPPVAAAPEAVLLPPVQAEAKAPVLEAPPVPIEAAAAPPAQEPAPLPPPLAEEPPVPAVPAFAPPVLLPPPLLASRPPLSEAPPLPLFAAAEAAIEPPQLVPEAPAFQAESVEDGRPQIEAMGRRSHSDAKAGSHVAHPAVEWGISPFAVGPDAAQVAEPHPRVEAAPPAPAIQAPPPPPVAAAPILAPPPPIPVRAPTPPPPSGPSRWARQEEKVMALNAAPAGSGKIVHTAFVVQLGELPPAVPSAVDLEDEIIE